MAKVKSQSAQASTPVQSHKNESKHLSSVKDGSITKHSQSSQAKSKEMAKQAVKAQEAQKKSKKVKEPSPELDSDESEEDDESDEDAGESSASSEEESDEEAPKSNGVKPNGVPKAEPEDSEDDEDDSEVDVPAPKTTSDVAPKAAVHSDSDDSEDDSDDEDSEDDDEEDEEDNKKANNVTNAPAVGSKPSKVASKDDDSEEDDDEDSDESEEDSDDSDDSDESDEEEKPAPKTNKRKADAEFAPPAKKAKNAEVNGLDDATKKNLFVGHLSYNVDEEWMRREFEIYGELTRVVHMVDRETQRPRGFGYIEFANAEDGVSAQEAMNGKEIDGRAINVDFSRPRTEQQPRQDRAKQYGDRQKSAPSATIFVANLAFSATSDAVGEEFGKHADVVGVRLPTDRETGEPKGFGYVEFASVEEAEKAFSAMEGQSILGRVPRLDYSTPRPDRDGNSFGGRGGRGGFDRGGRGGGRGRGGFDRGGRGGGRGGRGGSTNRGGFGDFQGKKMSLS